MQTEMEYSEEELKELVQDMRSITDRLYWTMFWGSIGGRAHAFIEFCGVMNKYVDICERASSQGIQFPFYNEHSKKPLPVEDHDVNYLAEKFACIFGPVFKNNPRLAKMFAEKALGLEVS